MHLARSYNLLHDTVHVAWSEVDKLHKHCCSQRQQQTILFRNTRTASGQRTAFGSRWSSTRCWWSWRTWLPTYWVTLCSGSTSTCCCRQWWCSALHWACGSPSTVSLPREVTSSTGELVYEMEFYVSLIMFSKKYITLIHQSEWQLCQTKMFLSCVSSDIRWLISDQSFQRKKNLHFPLLKEMCLHFWKFWLKLTETWCHKYKSQLLVNV